jgi:hypothetical protein
MHLPKDLIRHMYEKQDKADVANAFHWQVLSAVLNNELVVQHEAHDVKYEFRDLDQFICEWWDSSP